VKLLPVFRQNLGAGLAEPRAVLLEACQNNLVAVVHMSPAKPRDIARAPRIRPSALRGSCGDDQEKRNCEQKSGHLEYLPSTHTIEMVPQEGFEPPTPSLRSAGSPSPCGSRQDVLMLANRRRNGFRTGPNQVSRFRCFPRAHVIRCCATACQTAAVSAPAGIVIGTVLLPGPGLRRRGVH
jgi:hypothetical protein